MKVSVFEFNNYIEYLDAWIDTRPSKGRGEKSRFAAAMKCHSAYVTLVLQGASQLSLEQASLLNEYLGHKSDEGEFFLLLVQHARAGNRVLTEHFSRQIQHRLTERRALKNRLEYRKTLGEREQTVYYSAWYYGAIHVLLSVPEFRARESIASRLALPVSRVAEVLEFLVSVGLATEDSGGYRIGPSSVHVGEDSPLVSRHHLNWRLRAMESLDRPKLDELHYSSVATIARQDLPKARAILVRAIEEVRALVRDSPEEELFCYALDAFRV